MADAAVTETGNGVYSIDIKKLSVSAGTSTWSNDGDITVEASGKQVRVGALRISNGDQQISAQGVAGRAQEMNMNISGKNAWA